LLQAARNNFLVAVVRGSGSEAERRAHGGAIPGGSAAAGGEAAGRDRPGSSGPAPVHGVASLDLSTGEFELQACREWELRAELGRLEPSELLLPRSLEGLLRGRTVAPRTEDRSSVAGASRSEGPSTSGGAAGPHGPMTTYRDDWLFDLRTATEEIQRRYQVQSLDGFDFQDGDGVLVKAAGGLLAYVQEIRPGGVEHLRPPRIRRSGSAMLLDDMTRRNLELVEPLRRGEEGGTLLSVLDDTVTAMGARCLRRWILRPLLRPEEIWARQEGVAELFEDVDARRGIREALKEVGDFERLAGKLGTGRVSPREMLGLCRSLEALPGLRSRMEGPRSEVLSELIEELDLLEDVRELLGEAIADDPPQTLQEGGVIREGFNQELDEIRAVRDGARDFIASLQSRERERTGIQSLKVGFNKVFGYYLEVTNANLDKVPQDYIRKQTLSNSERYFTPELKEWEEKVFGAEEKAEALETELFREVRVRVAREVPRLQETAGRVARLDVLATLAQVASSRDYVRPEVHTEFDLEIRAGRHPVVETMMPREEFIANDLDLDEESGYIVILTGPNMSGKSTILRQVGLIQLLAQVGGYVPAVRARLPVCDRIFTRVGASDNLARGQSTFMVEMNETAAIVHGATDRSLVLLDEIGRGTSTYDGVSIAWAVTEHIHEHFGAKTVFATHYHELTQLGDLLPGVKNLNVAVRESNDDIVFLRRLEEGGADRSYGIQVARLAGLPAEIIDRAGELLAELEGSHSGAGEGLGRHGAHRPASEPPPDQLSMFAPADHPVVRNLRELTVEDMTPLEALNVLAELRKRADS
ncbi:MAG: DNA mismatch repair protein MutS, partial [Gemmatimonadota bacterium]